MAQLKEIVVSLPDEILSEVDVMAKKHKIDRSQMIAHIARLYIQRRQRLRDMKKGYTEMADINLEIANFCLEADNNALNLYEDMLS